MSVLVYSISLLLISVIIAASFHLQVGLGMMVIAMVGIFSSMVRLSEPDNSRADDDLDRQIEDILKHSSR